MTAEEKLARRAPIEAVAIDMSAAYRQAVEAACPQSALVYDLFHGWPSTAARWWIACGSGNPNARRARKGES